MVKYDKYYCKKLTEDTIISQGIYNQPEPNLQGQLCSNDQNFVSLPYILQDNCRENLER